MPAVLTTADTVTCLYQGTVTPGGSKLEAGGNPVVTASGLESKSVAGCKASASQQAPCSSVASVTIGKATKLEIGGSPALLSATTASTDQGASHPVGPVTAGQSKLEAS